MKKLNLNTMYKINKDDILETDFKMPDINWNEYYQDVIKNMIKKGYKIKEKIMILR